MPFQIVTIKREWDRTLFHDSTEGITHCTFTVGYWIGSLYLLVKMKPYEDSEHVMETLLEITVIGIAVKLFRQLN